jgi:hypothetical protein
MTHVYDPIKHRNAREENEAIKRGQTPKAWKTKPAKSRLLRVSNGSQTTPYLTVD